MRSLIRFNYNSEKLYHREHRGTQRIRTEELTGTRDASARIVKERPLMSSNGKTTNRNGRTDGKMNWESDPRWKGITRPYTWADVESLRGSMKIEHSLARHGAETLWNLLQTEP